MASALTRKAISSIRSILVVYQRRKLHGAADLALRTRENVSHAWQPAHRREHRGAQQTDDRYQALKPALESKTLSEGPEVSLDG